MQLLMPVSLYSPSSVMEATLYDRSYLLSPVRLLEAGVDYEIALFRLRTEGERRQASDKRVAEGGSAAHF